MASLFGALFDFLKCLALWFLAALLAGLVGLMNLLVTAAAAVLSVVLALLPTVDLGSVSLPSSIAQGLGWANYLLPVDFAVQLVLLILAVELGWFVVQWVLRFVRAVA